MSIHILPNPIEQQESSRSEEEVSPHLRRHRPATSDRLLASRTSKTVGSFKLWQKLPVIVLDAKNVLLQPKQNQAENLAATF